MLLQRPWSMTLLAAVVNVLLRLEAAVEVDGQPLVVLRGKGVGAKESSIKHHALLWARRSLCFAVGIVLRGGLVKRAQLYHSVSCRSSIRPSLPRITVVPHDCIIPI